MRFKISIKKIAIISIPLLLLYLIVSIFILDLGALKALGVILFGIYAIVMIIGMVTFSDFLWGTTDVMTPRQKRIFGKLFAVLGPLFFIGFFLYGKSQTSGIKLVLFSILYAVLAFSFILGIYGFVIFFKEYKARKKDVV